jgi:hypothetical protein
MISRKLLVLAVAFGVAGCSSDAPDVSSFGGTIRGEPFAPADATGFVMAAIPCAQLDGWNTTMVRVEFGSFEGLCALAVDQAFCGDKASARTAYVAVVRANVNGGPVPPIGPGTYGSDGAHVVDGNGVVYFVWAGLGDLDAACLPMTSAMYKEWTGSITLAEVSATRLRGRAEIGFDNGDRLSGTFDVPVCPSPDDALCASLKGGCAVRTCAP